MPAGQFNESNCISSPGHHKGLKAQISHLKKYRKCSKEHIDELCESAKILSTELFGCITGTRFSLKIYALSYEFEDGVSRFTHTPVKAVFIAENNQSQSITFFPEQRVD